MRRVLTGVVITLAAIVGMSAVVSAILAVTRPRETSTPARQTTPAVSVSITSDPTGSHVTVDGRDRGATPITVQLPQGTTHTYKITAVEPYKDYKLFKPYSGTLAADEDKTISVWIDRTSADEQAQQRADAEAARKRAAEAACRQRLSQAAVIIDDWHWGRTYGGAYVEAEGRVTNNTSTTLRSIQALVEYETSTGQFITSDYATIDFRDLLPGQTSPFSVLTSYNPAMSQALLRFRQFFGDEIRAVSRDNLGC